MPKIHYDHQALQLLGVPGARLATGLLQLDVSESTIGELLHNDLGLDDRAIDEALTAARRLLEESGGGPAGEAAAQHPRTRADDLEPDGTSGTQASGTQASGTQASGGETSGGSTSSG